MGSRGMSSSGVVLISHVQQHQSRRKKLPPSPQVDEGEEGYSTDTSLAAADAIPGKYMQTQGQQCDF